MRTDTKICSHCHQTLPLSDFSLHRGRPNYICRKCNAAHAKRWREQHPYPERYKYDAAQWRGYYARTRERRLELLREKNKRTRLRVLQHYGGAVPSCACCGETIIEFLCIDHIEGGGGEHRKKTGAGSCAMYWLIRNDFPEGFRVLCHNCNFSLGAYGYCPHSQITQKVRQRGVIKYG